VEIDLLYTQILSLCLLLLFAFFGGKISARFNMGEVVGQVLGGMVAGPVLLLGIHSILPRYGDALESLHFFTFLFLSVIVFSIGDELSLKNIRKSGKEALIICVVQAVSPWLAVTTTFLFLGFDIQISLIIGSMGIATAPTATFVIMNKLGIAGKMRSTLGGIVVLDDVIEVVVFSLTVQYALFSTLHGHHYAEGQILLPVLKDVTFAIGLGVLLFLFIRSVVNRKRLVLAKETREKIHGSDFLGKLLSELPGPSIEMLLLTSGSVGIFVALALHWHLPFLLTAITTGILVSNLNYRGIFDALHIENATSLFTLVFFALIGANSDLQSFHPQNYIFIGAYVLSRGGGKMLGTWAGCYFTKQEKRITQNLPKLMLPQAGVAAIEAFFVATILGEKGETILSIIFPGLVIFEIAGVWLSERTLRRWYSWESGGGEFLDEEEVIRRSLKNEKLDFLSLLNPNCLHIPFDVQSKGEAIWELVQSLRNEGFIYNPGHVLERILERERLGGITLGDDIAILHCRIGKIPRPAVALGILPMGRSIQFGDNEESSIDIIYMVVSPGESPELHLKVLASIAEFLSNKDMRTRLRYAKNHQEAMEIFQEHAQNNHHSES
jgi:Kef-type K+ transport system membrane component KefB/mannitol/fructose-specific phosphotransferase system IIA component (Ntr-type)